MPRACTSCGGGAQLRRNANGDAFCKECFVTTFEDEVHEVITRYRLMPRGTRVCVGVSGGKDSSALLHCLWSLNKRYDYGIELLMLAIDEGISGYRDESIVCVRKMEAFYGLPCLILSYNDLYGGWTMDRISGKIQALNAGQNCTSCGIFRRQALEIGADKLKADVIATGHNADDSLETILMNYLRCDVKRLANCCGPSTGCPTHRREGQLQRIKPFFFSSQKEVVLYCHFLQLDYFSVECPYSTTAFRGTVRQLIKELETIDPFCVRRALASFASEASADTCSCEQTPDAHHCERCGAVMLAEGQCKACQLVQKLDDLR